MGYSIRLASFMLVSATLMVSVDGVVVYTCCSPCGNVSHTLYGTRRSPDSSYDFSWTSQDSCGSSQPCSLSAYGGCWGAQPNIRQLLVLLWRRPSADSTTNFDALPVMECSLMAKAARFTYAVLYDDECFGTDDEAIFLQGPAGVSCSAERTGSADTLDVYFFPEIPDDQLNDTLACVSNATLNTGIQGELCTSYDDQLLTYSEFGSLLESPATPFDSGQYWLVDDRNQAMCSKFSITLPNTFHCENSHDHTYYCNSSSSNEWMEWQSVCDTTPCLSPWLRYRLRGVEQVDIVIMQTTTAATTTGDISLSEDAVLQALADLTNSWSDESQVSAGDAVRGLNLLSELVGGGLKAREVQMVVSLLTSLSVKLSVNESAAAVGLLVRLTTSLDTLLSDEMAWRKTNLFSELLEPMEEITRKCGASLRNKTRQEAFHFSITTETLESSAHSTSSYDFKDRQVTVSLPDEVFSTSSSADMVAIVHDKAGYLLGNPNITEEFVDEEAVDSNQILGDVVLSLALESVSPSDRLAHPVEIYLPLNLEWVAKANNVPLSSYLKFSPHCVFWNSSQGIWMSNGCHTSVSAQQVRCLCNHLTSFSVLFRYTEYMTDPNSPYGKALTIIGQIGCSISIIALVITFCLFVYLDNLRSERKKIHMNLVVALALAQLTHVAGINRTADIGLCRATAVLLHFFYTATFTWMLCEGLQLYFKIIAVFNSEKKSNRAIFYAIGWGVPVVIVGVSMAARLTGYGTATFCWLSLEDNLVWAFIAPVCAVILINLGIMARVIKIIIGSAKKSLTQAQRKNISLVKAGVKAVAILTPLLGTNWVFGLLVVNQHTQVFEVLFVILNSLQGLFIFLFHCVGSSEVRSALMHKKAQHANKVGHNSFISCGSSAPSEALRKFFFLFEKPKVSGELAEDAVNDLVEGKLGPNLGGLKHQVSCPDSGYGDSKTDRSSSHSSIASGSNGAMYNLSQRAKTTVGE